MRRAKIMSRTNAHGVSQSGFTLVELLIAMSLTLIIVVAAQRYVAGVTSDQEHLSKQQDQTSQTYIILSNIQHDIERAGFSPVASLGKSTVVPVKIQKCAIDDCVGDELIVSYWQYASSEIYDCIGDKVTKEGDWGLVENTYRVRKSGELACSGNGGTKNKNDPLLNNIHSHSWAISSETGENRILSICLTTIMDKNEQVAGNAQAKSCSDLSLDDKKAYRTTQLDILVKPQRVAIDSSTGAQ